MRLFVVLKTIFTMATLLLAVADNEAPNSHLSASQDAMQDEHDQPNTRLIRGRKLQQDETEASEIHGFNEESILRPDDSIYRRGSWDGAPIVIEEYKLVFFTVPKVGCTVWKQLFRRMMGFGDWRKQEDPHWPHNPEINGLKYLYDYSLEQANHFMTSPDYTRAIFVRDPKERVLSAFLDKSIRMEGDFIRNKCCLEAPDVDQCVKNAMTFDGFVDSVMTMCNDDHWRPQMERMDAKFWPYINFVGHMDHVTEDSEALLRHIGAWEAYGETGWGTDKDQAIFISNDGRKHAMGAREHLSQHYTVEIEQRVEDFYDEDYNFQLLDLKRHSIVAV